jgi:circadian clock protein KaiC
MNSPIDTTYLADTVVLFRYFEAMGEVKLALSVVKKRSGKHERTIRELRLDIGGITVGPPLRDFHGVLTGTPIFREPSGPPEGPEHG